MWTVYVTIGENPQTEDTFNTLAEAYAFARSSCQLTDDEMLELTRRDYFERPGRYVTITNNNA
jgi:hypothetical protein